MNSANANDTFHCTATDYQGSWCKVVTETGTTVERYNFDPWGRRRHPDNWNIYYVPTSFTFDRGYTGHEMLDAFGLINMNGRVYDPIVARFLSPDNYVQAPDNSQGFNRYSYCLNNPLVYSDPTGEFFIADDILIAMAAAAIFNGLNSGVQAQLNGSSFWSGAWKGTLTGAISGGIGAYFAGFAPMGVFQGAFFGGITGGFAGGFTGGISSSLSGGSFGDGFISGFYNGLFSGAIGGGVSGGYHAKMYNDQSENLIGPKPMNVPDGYDIITGRPYNITVKGDFLTPDVLQDLGSMDCAFATQAYIDNQLNGNNSTTVSMKSELQNKDGNMAAIGIKYAKMRNIDITAEPEKDGKISLSQKKQIGYNLNGGYKIAFRLDNKNATIDHAVGVKGYLEKQVMNYKMAVIRSTIKQYYLMDPENRIFSISSSSNRIQRAYLYIK